MAFGDCEASLENSTFSITCGPAYTVVWLPSVTLLTHLTMDSSIACPSITPETRRHSPANSVSGALADFAGTAFLDARVLVFAGAGVTPRVNVSSAKPLPAGAAKRDGRTAPRVARQSFKVSPSSL